MKKVTNNIIMGMLLLIVFSCNNSVLDKKGYVAYLQDEDNGFIHKVELEELAYTFQYRPSELMALQENTGMNKTQKDMRVKDLEGTLNFVVKIKTIKSNVPPLKYNISSLAEYNSRINYYMSAAQKDFNIRYGDVTLTPTAYSYETNYGLTPEDAIVLQFTLPNGEKKIMHDILLSYNDRIFQNGIIKTKFSKTNLNNIPKLNV